MDEGLRPVLVRKNSFRSRLRRFVGQRNFTLDGNSRIRAILCFSSLKDSGGGEIFGEGLELDTTRKQFGKSEYPTRFTREGREMQFWDASRTEHPPTSP